MKKIIAAIILIVLVISLSINVLGCTGYSEVDLLCAINTVKIFVNGSPIDKGHNMEVESIVYKGTTYVPLRKISEKLDCNVIYEPNTKSIYIDKFGEELYGW